MLDEARRFKRRLQQDGIRNGTTKILRYLGHRKIPKQVNNWIETKTLCKKDLERISSESDTPFSFYDDELEYWLAPPTYPGDVSNEAQREFRSIYPETVVTDPPFVCEIPDVTIISSFAYPVCSSGFLPDRGMSPSSSAVGFLMAASQGISPRGGSVRGPRAQFERVLSLTGPFDQNYYHWFRDYLPRLEGIEHLNRDDPTLTILIPNDPPSWLEDSLRLTGVDKYDLREWPGAPIHVDRYVLSRYRLESSDSAANRSPVMPKKNYRWIADRIIDNASIRSGVRNRIYISREDATTRRTINETEIMDVLSEFGFERYKLSEFDFQSQVELFANADAIVGAHGAGLINMLFASDATILELLGPKTQYADPGQFYTMARVLGHDYSCLEAECVGRDILVEKRKLKNVCTRIFD
jgi:hypothetical protein